MRFCLQIYFFQLNVVPCHDLFQLQNILNVNILTMSILISVNVYGGLISGSCTPARSHVNISFIV